MRRDGSWRLCGVTDEGLERTIQEAREMSKPGKVSAKKLEHPKVGTIKEWGEEASRNFVRTLTSSKKAQAIYRLARQCLKIPETKE